MAVFDVFAVKYTYLKPQNVLIEDQNILMISYTYEAKICRTTPAYYYVTHVSYYHTCGRCRQCDLNIQDGQGRAPLHYAAARLDTSTVTSLVEAGAGVNTQDMLGNMRES